MRNKEERGNVSKRLMNKIEEKNKGGRKMKSIGSKKMKNRNFGKKK